MKEQRETAVQACSAKRRIPLYAVIVTVVFAAAVVFSATFFPMRYVAARERERYEGIIERYERGELQSDARYDAVQLSAILDYLQKNSIYSLPDSDALTEALIEAALDAMGDRHGTYYNPEEYEKHRDSVSGDLCGIGVTVAESEQGYIEVLHVHAGAPIDGIGRKGDLITAVDGVDVRSLGYDAAVKLISGEAGTEAVLTVLRNGQSMTLTVLRGDYTKQTVIRREIAVGSRRLGYVMVTEFDRHTYAQFKDAVSALEAAGVSGFIFDMRNNPGGLLQAVAEVLAYVLPDGEIVHVDYASEKLSDYTVTAEDGYLRQNGEKKTLYCEGGHEITVPIAVLVNGGTASAAELFSAAIRDYAADGRIDAELVGVRTYGKGTVQTTDTAAAHAQGAALKISVAYYNPPCNVSYDGQGIEPGRRAELPKELEGVSIHKLTGETDTQLAEAIAVLTEAR